MEQKCDNCKWSKTSKTLLRMHMMTNHQNNHRTGESLQSKYRDKSNQGNETSKRYIIKRIQCQNWNKKFNKKETFRRHMAFIHKVTLQGTNIENKPYNNLTLPENTRMLRNHKNKHSTLIGNN